MSRFRRRRLGGLSRGVGRGVGGRLGGRFHGRRRRRDRRLRRLGSRLQRRDHGGFRRRLGGRFDRGLGRGFDGGFRRGLGLRVNRARQRLVPDRRSIHVHLGVDRRTCARRVRRDDVLRREVTGHGLADQLFTGDVDADRVRLRSGVAHLQREGATVRVLVGARCRHLTLHRNALGVGVDETRLTCSKCGRRGQGEDEERQGATDSESGALLLDHSVIVVGGHFWSLLFSRIVRTLAGIS